MKNTGSSVFEEAYLIIRGDYPADTSPSPTLAEEAERIINETSGLFRDKHKKRLAFLKVAIFALGAACSSAIIGIISLIVHAL